MSENVNEAKRLLRKEAKKLTTALQKETSRKRGPLVRQMHEIRQMMSPTYAYTSLAGQDSVVDQIMKAKRGGTFVDVGGADGVTGSNSFFLEAHRGWTGVLLEPVPAQVERAKINRACPCLEIAVAPTQGEADFIEITEGYTRMSGLSKTYNAQLLKTVRANSRHGENTIKVRTSPLSTVLNDAELPNPDYVSLALTGGEIACLAEFPFADHDVKIWSIENSTGTPKLKEIMDQNGYDLVEFCGADEMYFKRSS